MKSIGGVSGLLFGNPGQLVAQLLAIAVIAPFAFIDSFALENMLAINYEVDKEETVAMANVGASITNINIVKNNMSGFTRDIFKGGNQITEEIQRQLHIDLCKV
jgi:Tfp pilus assembly PilM family ATPase